MTYNRFEDLPVWRSAIELARRIFELTQDALFRRAGDACNQLRRASLSVSNNIAEGFERGTTSELVTFLYIARGSAGEVRSMLRFIEHWQPDSHLRPAIGELIRMSESCSRQIRGWAEAMQNSNIKGQRYQTQHSQAEYTRKKDADAFWAMITKANAEALARSQAKEAQKHSESAAERPTEKAPTSDTQGSAS